MRTLLRVLLLLSALLSAVVMLACGPSRSGGGGGGAELGESCDGEDGEETCDGSVALECKTQEDGSFVWEGEDCRDSGERCVRGECVEVEENNSASNNSGSCPDRSGSWSFEEHCDPSLVGTSYEITQAGCELTVASVGWTGSVDAEGVVTIGGPVPGGALTCVGQSTEDRLEASCVPTCDVVLVR